MSIEGCDSYGFEEIGEYWEPILEWEDEVIDTTNEVNLDQRVAKIFQAKKQKKQSVAYLHTQNPRMRCLSLRMEGPSEPDIPLNQLSQKQIDFLTFQWDGEDEGYFGEPPFVARTSEYRDEGFMLAPAYGNSYAVPCGFKKSFKKICHKTGKTWRKHKVEIIIGTLVVVGIAITVVVVTTTGCAGGGAIIAGGGAVLDRLINGRQEDGSTPDFSFDSNDSPAQELHEHPTLQSFDEKWEDIKKSPYFMNRGIEPQSPPTPTYSAKPLPPDLIRPWAPQAPNSMFVEKPKEPVLPLPPKQPEPHAYPPLNPNQPMTFGEWYREFIDKEQNGVLYYPDEALTKAADPIKTPKPDQFIKDKKTESSYDVNILCQDEMAYAAKAWHERSQVDPPIISQRLPTLGEPNKDLLILGINGMDTNLNEALSHQAYLKDLTPEGVGIDFIHNHSHSAPIDLAEIFGLNYFGYSPNTANLLKEAWTEFHERHKDNPSKKILQVCHSQGAIHVNNALASCPEEVRQRLIVLSLAPAKIVPEGTCYQSFNYASKNDIVHYGELIHPSFFDPNETGISPLLTMKLEQREQLILLEPHPGAKGIDHDLQTETFKQNLKIRIKDYIYNNGEYEK